MKKLRNNPKEKIDSLVFTTVMSGDYSGMPEWTIGHPMPTINKHCILP